MKEQIALLEEVLQKYDLEKPSSRKTKKRVAAAKKRTLIIIMKKAGIYSTYLSIATSLYFFAKKFGIGLSLAKSALTLSIATVTTATALISSGTYVIIKKVILKEEKKVKVEIRKDEPAKVIEKPKQKQKQIRKIEPYPKTLDGIKKRYGRVDEINLYNGKKLLGVILKRGNICTILTTKGFLNISIKDIKSERRVK